MDPFIAAALRACGRIRERLKTPDESLYELHCAGHGGDRSRGADLAAEAICFEELSPYGSVFSEESGWMSPPGLISIICDPLDGSDNFVSEFPYYGVSIAREENGATTGAVVCNLVTAECFVRTPEVYGRVLLDDPATLLMVEPISHPRIGLFEKSPEHPELVALLMGRKHKFRSPGALALSLAYAPYVKYVLFLGTMRPYDIAAGLYLIRHLHVHQDERYILACSDPELFEEIRAIVEKEYF